MYPLKDIRPGQKGIGKTVFSEGKIDEFQVEILGVVENIGPRQSLILARLSGGPLADMGVLQGMSGSPVFIDGRLAGAVAMAFPFSKEPIAGIRPIEDMLRVHETTTGPPRKVAVSPLDQKLLESLQPAESVSAGGQKLVNIVTPIAFGGFTRGTLRHFEPQLHALGLEPQQGISGGGGRLEHAFGDPSAIQPGSMISVQLLTGDMSVGADGTVTCVDGNKLYAFGHRFLSIGNTSLPFARAEVLTLLPNLSSSFKISVPREWMGAITADRSVAVAGEFGRRANMVPVSISVVQHEKNGSVAARSSYQMDMVTDSFLSPLLLQMMVFSTIDATEHVMGTATYAIDGEIRFRGESSPVRVQNTYAGDVNVPLQAAMSAALPLAYAMQSGLDNLRVERVSLTIDAFDERKQLQITQAWAGNPRVRPGEDVNLTVLLVADNGSESVRKLKYHVPIGADIGPLYFTVADGINTNLSEYQRFASAQPRSVDQLLALLNSVRPNTKAYVRVWRPEPSFAVEGKDLPGPPPSVSLILGRDQAAMGGLSPSQNSKITELEIDAGDVAISGAQSIQVEVKE